MNTHQMFSFSRLALVMKRDFLENWKNNLYLFLGIFLAFLLVYLVNMNSFNGPQYMLHRYIGSHAEAFIALACMLLVYFASETMSSMRTKEGRLSFLMLPATPLEKFVARGLYVTLGIFLMLVLASLLAEAAHWAFMPFFPKLPDTFRICVWPEAMGEIWDTLNPFQTQTYSLPTKGQSVETWPSAERSLFFEIMFAYWIAFWFHSLYVLGGNYFGKYAFFKTSGVLILCAMLYGYLLDLIPVRDTFFEVEEIAKQHTPWMTEQIASGIGGLFFFCLTAFNWWLAYRLFTRRQVIQPKFRLP